MRQESCLDFLPLARQLGLSHGLLQKLLLFLREAAEHEPWLQPDLPVLLQVFGRESKL